MMVSTLGACAAHRIWWQTSSGNTLMNCRFNSSPALVYPQDKGENPQAMLRWSDNGGSTWSNEHWTTIGLIGKYANRAIWRRLGTARDRVFEVSISDPVKAVIISANLKSSVGEN
jgi:hypothetical protein